MLSKSAAATNSFLVLNAPTKEVQDYKQMKPTGAVSWVWDHFSVYDPKYNRKSQAVCNHCFLKYTKDPHNPWREEGIQQSIGLVA